MNIRDWHSHKEQMCDLGRHSWSIARLVELARDLPVTEAPIDCLNVYCVYNDISLRDMVMHMKAVNAANLDYPIILDEDGILMDGRHRIMKAILTGAKTIKMVRFDENPPPCLSKEETP